MKTALGEGGRTPMHRLRWISLSSAVVAVGLAWSVLGWAATTYPVSDITLILPTGPSPGIDPFLRLLARESEPALGKRIVVVNKPGGSWTIGTAEVVRAKPEGYVLALTSNNAVGFQPLVAKVPYGGPEDYQPIVKLADAPVGIMVKADAPWKTLADYVADAKARPGKLRAALPGLLTQADLDLRLFNKIAGIDIAGAPFTGGGGEMLNAVLGGHVESAVGNPAIFLAQIKAGKARALTVFSKSRLSALPDVPTTVELGYNVTFPVMYFLMGPKNLDRDVLAKLVHVFTDAVQSAKVQAFMKENGYLTEPLGPEALTREINEHREIYRKLVQDLKLEGKR